MSKHVSLRSRLGPGVSRCTGAPFAQLLPSMLGAVLLLLVIDPVLGAEALAIPEAEALQPPTTARLAAVLTAAQREGWAAQTGALRLAAIHAYEREQLAAAEGWFHVGQWAALFSEPEERFQARWLEAMRTAKVAIPATMQRDAGRGRLLGDPLTPEFKAWLVGHADFSAEFFALLSPLDYAPNVLRILNELYFYDPTRFAKYAHLALALAVVYDVPPPAGWPHGQVTPAALPRKFPPATAAFAWWTQQDQLGRTDHRLTALGAAELKFVVDTAAPLNELEWAQQIADYPLALLPRAYTMIRYRPDRIARNEMLWPGSTYRLADILGAGGICVDQAYFAAEFGKARGVPTLLFRGEGGSGRHAWFGFLDGKQNWQLDAGRFAEQRFVTGFAYDPQTWRELTEHDVKFLAERFREKTSYRQSRIHAEFAQGFFLAGDTTAATAAARRAINAEPRNQAGWDTLLAALQTAGKGAPELEAVLREAQQAFERYPDLATFYANRLTASLRARGETAAAENEERRIAARNRGSRTDLNVRQARETLLRAVTSQPLAEQIRLYDSAVDTVGRAGGIAFFDQIVVGFAEHLMSLHENAEALHAIERAQRTLVVEPGSQLEQELARLFKEAKASK